MLGPFDELSIVNADAEVEQSIRMNPAQKIHIELKISGCLFNLLLLS